MFFFCLNQKHIEPMMVRIVFQSEKNKKVVKLIDESKFIAISLECCASARKRIVLVEKTGKERLSGKKSKIWCDEREFDVRVHIPIRDKARNTLRPLSYNRLDIRLHIDLGIHSLLARFLNRNYKTQTFINDFKMLCEMCKCVRVRVCCFFFYFFLL